MSNDSKHRPLSSSDLDQSRAEHLRLRAHANHARMRAQEVRGAWEIEADLAYGLAQVDGAMSIAPAPWLDLTGRQAEAIRLEAEAAALAKECEEAEERWHALLRQVMAALPGPAAQSDAKVIKRETSL